MNAIAATSPPMSPSGGFPADAPRTAAATSVASSRKNRITRWVMPAIVPCGESRARIADRADHERMSELRSSPPTVHDHPYEAELDLERERWDEIAATCRSMIEADRLRPGYFRDPEWSVKDLIGHLGAWMADAEQHLLRIEVGTEVDEPRDIDALNA